MVENLQLFYLGPILIIIGLVIMMLSFKPRGSGATGIILLGPIPIIWSGRNRSLILLLLLAAIFFAILPWVFIL